MHSKIPVTLLAAVSAVGSTQSHPYFCMLTVLRGDPHATNSKALSAFGSLLKQFFYKTSEWRQLTLYLSSLFFFLLLQFLRASESSMGFKRNALSVILMKLSLRKV